MRSFGTSLVTQSEAELAEYRARGAGVVFQSDNLWPTLSARENVVMALRLAAQDIRHPMPTLPSPSSVSASASIIARVPLGRRAAGGRNRRRNRLRLPGSNLLSNFTALENVAFAA